MAQKADMQSFLDLMLHPLPAHFLRPFSAAYFQAAAVRHFACGRARLMGIMAHCPQ